MAKAKLVLNIRTYFRNDVFSEIFIWSVPVPVRASLHNFKYSLAFVAFDECQLRYDNEAGKGDHRHSGAEEAPYRFESIDRLLADFEADVKGWLDDNP
jgi:hypothetical protein